MLLPYPCHVKGYIAYIPSSAHFNPLRGTSSRAGRKITKTGVRISSLVSPTKMEQLEILKEMMLAMAASAYLQSSVLRRHMSHQRIFLVSQVSNLLRILSAKLRVANRFGHHFDNPWAHQQLLGLTVPHPQAKNTAAVAGKHGHHQEA